MFHFCLMTEYQQRETELRSQTSILYMHFSASPKLCVYITFRSFWSQNILKVQLVGEYA